MNSTSVKANTEITKAQGKSLKKPEFWEISAESYSSASGNRLTNPDARKTPDENALKHPMSLIFIFIFEDL